MLPLGEFQSYTLPDFRAALNVKSKECLQILKKFSEYRTAILIEVFYCVQSVIFFGKYFVIFKNVSGSEFLSQN